MMGDPYADRIDEIAARDPEREGVAEAAPQARPLSHGVSLLRDLAAVTEEHGSNALIEKLSTTGATNILGQYMYPSYVTTIAAPTGGKKSAYTLNDLLYVAQRGGGVLLHSLEMPEWEVAARAGAILSQAPFEWFVGKYGNLADDEKARAKAEVEKGFTRLADLPFEVDDRADVTVEAIMESARAAKSRNPNLRIVAVDYLQIVGVSKSVERQSRTYQLEHIMKRLKVLAMELGINVVVLSQVSRDLVDRRTGQMREPVLADLSDSSGIEKHSNQVVFLHSDLSSLSEPNLRRLQEAFPEVLDGMGEYVNDPTLTAVIVAKNRGAPQGISLIRFIPEHFRFVDPDVPIWAEYTPPARYSNGERVVKERLAEIFRRQ